MYSHDVFWKHLKKLHYLWLVFTIVISVINYKYEKCTYFKYFPSSLYPMKSGADINATKMWFTSGFFKSDLSRSKLIFFSFNRFANDLTLISSQTLQAFYFYNAWWMMSFLFIFILVSISSYTSMISNSSICLSFWYLLLSNHPTSLDSHFTSFPNPCNLLPLSLN